MVKQLLVGGLIGRCDFPTCFLDGALIRSYFSDGWFNHQPDELQPIMLICIGISWLSSVAGCPTGGRNEENHFEDSSNNRRDMGTDHF